jgi:hypothetical protein
MWSEERVAVLKNEEGTTSLLASLRSLAVNDATNTQTDCTLALVRAQLFSLVSKNNLLQSTLWLPFSSPYFGYTTCSNEHTQSQVCTMPYQQRL